MTLEGKGRCMNKNEFEKVKKSSANVRYEYFIKKIVDYEEVWGLYDNGWAISEDDNGNKMIPLWPKKEFAEFCAQDEWSNYNPKKINLYEFLDFWLQKMKDDNLLPSLFWNNEDSAVVSIETLKLDINRELDNY